MVVEGALFAMLTWVCHLKKRFRRHVQCPVSPLFHQLILRRVGLGCLSLSFRFGQLAASTNRHESHCLVR